MADRYDRAENKAAHATFEQLKAANKSGATSPIYPRSIFSRGLTRNSSQETLVSLPATEVESNASLYYPGPPVNSPSTQSVVSNVNTLDTDSILEKLRNMPGQLTTPPPSNKGDKGYKRDMKTPAQSRVSKADSPGLTFPEHSTWAGVAEEDTTIALQRLTMLAKDEHKKDDSRTIEQYYSERLTKLIKKGEISFDPQYFSSA